MKPHNTIKNNGLAFSYIRCSSPEQIKGDTKRRQIAEAEAYAKANGLFLSEQGYEDLGISAYHGKNTDEGSDLHALIGAIKDGRIPKGSTIIVENLDRISRDYITNSLSVFMDLIRAGVSIVTLTDKKVYTVESIQKNPFDLMYSIMILARGHEESDAKSIRIGAAWKNAQANANTKKIAQNYPGWLDLNNNKFTVLEDRAAIVKDIFKQYLSGKGTGAIARDLNTRGITTFTGKRWVATTVKFYLKFPAVIGEYHAGKREHGKKVLTGHIVPDYYPQIISPEDFYKAQGRLKLNPSKKGRPQPEEANLFSGIIVCGYCGGSMGILNGHKGKSFICWNGVNGGCIRVAYTAEDIETLVLSRLTAIAKDMESSKSNQSRIAELDGKIAEIDTKISNLVKLVEAGVEVVEVSNRLKALKQERIDCEDAIAREKGILSITGFEVFQKWAIDTIENGKSEERLKIKPHIRRHVKCIRVFPAGPSAEPYKNLLAEYAKQGIPGSKCFQKIRQQLAIHKKKYFELELHSPVMIDGVLGTTLTLDRWGQNVRATKTGFQTFKAFP